MKSGARMVKDGLPNLKRHVAELAKKKVLVGIPGDSSERIEADGSTAPINNAALGYIHEFGSPAQNIPARPWLMPGVRDALPRATDMLKQAGTAALQGDAAKADRGFHSAGLIAASAVKNKLSTGPFTPLAPATLEARRARGLTRENPLVDTANLQNHVSYVVKD